MKKIAFISAVLFFFLNSAMMPAPEPDTKGKSGIEFQTGSWDEVRQLAQKENKIIFLDVYATWCGPCKWLKSKTFPDRELGEFFNSNFINYAIDAEKGEGIVLSRKYSVRGYPTLLFIDSKGELIAKTVGFHTTAELLEIGQQVAGY